MEVDVLSAAAGNVSARPPEGSERAQAISNTELRQPPTDAARRAVGVVRGQTSIQLVPVPEPMFHAAALEDRTGVGALVGCYRLSVDAWPELPAQGEPAQGDAWQPPIRFELTDSVGTERFEQGQLVLRPRIGEPHPELGYRPNAFWVPVTGDSVRLVWTNGLVELDARLAVRGNTLEGRVRVFPDMMAEARPSPGAAARAVRVRCPDDDG